MADPIVGWYAAGAGLIGAGAVAAGVRAIVLARRPAGGQRHTGWDEHMPELVALRTAPTEVIPSVEPGYQGRHWYPGVAEDSGAIPRHAAVEAHLRGEPS